MEIIQALGLNSTLLPQLAIFLVGYLVLNFLVFRPYMNAFQARKGATEGNQEVAEKIALETQDIQYRYETRARDINSQIKTIFDAARKDATRLQEEIVFKAREEAEALTKKNRDAIRVGVGKAKDELKRSVPELTQEISNRLLGKEVH